MAIRISYHGPYQIHRHRDSKGNYDVEAIRQDLKARVPAHIAHRSGVYIYYQRTAAGKLKAKYVGVTCQEPAPLRIKYFCTTISSPGVM